MADSVAYAASRLLELLDVVDSRSLDGQAKSRIERIRALLRGLEHQFREVQSDSARARQWGRDIREFSYRFENQQLEAGEYPKDKGGKRRLGLGKRWSSSTKQKEIASTMSQLEDMLQRLHEIGTYNFKDDDLIRTKKTAYGPHEFVEIRTGEMDRLISHLIDGDCQVVCLTGMGGTGKTTLARQLFNYSRIRQEYANRIWVDVSQTFERRKIMELITENLGLRRFDYGSYSDKMTEEELARRISSYIQDHRVLVVLDDICSLDDWESLRIILPNDERRSRSKILITTRMKQVAETTHRSQPRCVHLRRLTDDQGCKLLLRNVPDYLINKMREDMGKKIVNFCAGLPLTIVSFLRSMATKHTLEEWEDIVNKRLIFASSRRLETREVQATLEFLASSYDNLPYILKLVFLYMAVLQEDSRVEIEKLYLICLADGLISSKQLQRGERLVGVAENYVTEMAQRSMVDIDEGEVPMMARFKSCQVNRLMLDLALLKNADEGFFKIVEFERGNQLVPDSLSSSSSSRGRAFRVAINLDEYEEGHGFPLEDDEKMNARVLLFSAKRKQVWPREFSSLAKFKYLRVLEFNGFNFELTMLPEGITSSIHLRYLSFKDCVLRELPSSIGNLVFLHTLDLRVQQSTALIIPNVLWKMKKLRHLFFPRLFETHEGKLRLDGLTELEVITNFNAWMFIVKDLLLLPNLQYLTFNVDGNLEDIDCIVKRMIMNSDADLLFTSMEIRNFDCYTEERHSVFRKLLACQSLRVISMEGHLRLMPMYHKLSQNLTRIVFIGSEMIEDPMKTLEKLPKLCELVLDDAFVGKEMVCSASGFVELKILEVLNLQFLAEWNVEDGAMAKLSTLAIANCGKLEMLPEGLKFVRGLQKLDVSRMSKDFQNRIRKVDPTMGQDTDKVEHVPSIIFKD